MSTMRPPICDALDSRLPSSSCPVHEKSLPREDQEGDGARASAAPFPQNKAQSRGKGRSPILQLTPRGLVLVLLSAAALAFFAGAMSRILLSIPAGAHPPTAAASHVEGEGDEGKDGRGGTREARPPAGQVLSVDMKHVDADFLLCQDRLTRAMIDLVDEYELAMLSYHCHTLAPAGVACAAVLLEGHVSFRTWPSDGTIVLDLFTKGAEPLTGSLPVVEKLFAVPGLGLEPSTVWSHKLRGFRPPDHSPLERDLGLDLEVHGHEMKVQLLSEKTEFQHVTVLEYIAPRQCSLASYEKSLSGDGSYESLHPEMYRPDKVLFLDGVEQSSLYGDAAYHEALVHPAMLAHPDPGRVAIIGGGEGATLREVLKHNTVDEVYMIEIDEELVTLCAEYLPEWSDCSDNPGSDVGSCFNDPRATVVFDDAFKFFLNNFSGDDGDDSEGDSSDDSEVGGKEDKFDIIIMDALDPEQMVEFVGNLYKDDDFVQSLFDGLSEEGVLVIQLGETDKINEPPSEMGPGIDKANMVKKLQEVGFQSMHSYEEVHSHFDAPWSYLVSFKTTKSRANWYRTSAEVELELHQRLHRTNSGRPVLAFFDGPTMMGYQVPSKAQETKYCLQLDAPWECGEYVGFDPEEVNVPMAHFNVGKSGAGQYAGRGLFALRDIPEGSNLDMASAVKAFHVLPSTLDVIEDLYEWVEKYDTEYDLVKNELSSVKTFTEGYGYGNYLYGQISYSVDSGILTFCNHGCNGTYNYGGNDSDVNVTEMTVGIDRAPEHVMNDFSAVYSPVYERHLRQILATGDTVLHDIKKGDEILCNYLSFVGVQDDWKEDVTGLRGQCAGNAVGDITAYEYKNKAAGVQSVTDHDTVEGCAGISP